MANENLPLIDITVDCDGWPDQQTISAWVEAAVSAAITNGSLKLVQGSELSLLLTNNAKMRELNSTWRNVNRPTNVLSFPGREMTPDEAGGPVLGDIILAVETVKEEAELENRPFKHHFSHLIVHGFFHLFGYDHENEKEAVVMEALESKALASLGISDPYANA